MENSTQKLLDLFNNDINNEENDNNNMDMNFNYDVLKLINQREYPADPNAKYPDGTSILTMAFRRFLNSPPDNNFIIYNRYRLIHLLIKYGAMLSAEDQTPQIKSQLSELINPKLVDKIYDIANEINNEKKDKIVATFEMIRKRKLEDIYENMEDLRDYMGAKGGKRKQRKSKKQNRKQRKSKKKQRKPSLYVK